VITWDVFGLPVALGIPAVVVLVEIDLVEELVVVV